MAETLKKYEKVIVFMVRFSCNLAIFCLSQDLVKFEFGFFWGLVLVYFWIILEDAQAFLKNCLIFARVFWRAEPWVGSSERA